MADGRSASDPDGLAASPQPGDGRIARWRQTRLVDPDTARGIAYYSHHDRRDRLGELLIEHVARVAAAVPPPARATAWLHDVLEHSDTAPGLLRDQGLTDLEDEALGLLTRGVDEPFELHMLRVVHAPGPAGELARAIKLADLDDHLVQAARYPLRVDLPPYAWARRHLAGSTDRAWLPS
jgi:hypothetical protein